MVRRVEDDFNGPKGAVTAVSRLDFAAQVRVNVVLTPAGTVVLRCSGCRSEVLLSDADKAAAGVEVTQQEMREVELRLVHRVPCSLL